MEAPGQELEVPLAKCCSVFCSQVRRLNPGMCPTVPKQDTRVEHAEQAGLVNEHEHALPTS